MQSEAEYLSSKGVNCGKTDECENYQKHPEDQPEDSASSPHMNVIVKEEEEEEPLCGTSNLGINGSY